VRETAVAHKYVRALFDSAREEGTLDRVAGDMDALGRLETEDAAFLGFLVSPEVPTERKMEFLEAVFAPRLSGLAVDFLRLLVDKARIDLLPEMCREFAGLYEEHQGIQRARIETAVPLTGDQEARLKAELDRLTGKQVVLEKRVDRELLGGVVVHLGNTIIDRSLRHGIKRMRETLLRAEVNQ
jgi:F-type H+-transporting ATPase subunit delta